MSRHPVFCAITQQPGHGGIARVSSLVWHVLQQASKNRCRLIKLLPEGKQHATVADKLRFIGTMLGEYSSQNIDWIMYEHLGLARVQSLIPKPLRRPYAVFLYSIDSWNELSPGRKRILRQAEKRIAISHYTARRVATAHADIGPIDVCHLALAPTPSEIGVPIVDSRVPISQSPIPAAGADASLLERIQPNSVLIVGRMLGSERHKGHDHLIDAWPLVMARVPDAQLVIVGSGDDASRLEAKAASTCIAGGILFTGQVSDETLESIYQRAALFAMPSRGEGFGLVYLEAMQHRLPCIGSPQDAAAEIIEDKVTGFLIDQSDISGLAQRIVTLLQNPSQRREMGEAGYVRLQENFSFEQFKQRFLGILGSRFRIG